MNVGLKIENNFSPALARAFSDSRMRPDMARAINTIMRQWVSYAIAKIPKANRTKIKRRMEARAMKSRWVQARQSSWRKRRGVPTAYHALRYSLAAHIVWATNWSPKGSSSRGVSATQFYDNVRRYINARQFSAGYLKSGLAPALDVFRVRLGQAERGPRYRRGKVGFADEAKPTERILDAKVESWVDGIMEVAPHAFTASLPEVERTVNEWILKNLADRAAEQGLSVRRN